MTPTRRWITAALNAGLDAPPLPWTRGARRRPAAIPARTATKPAPITGKAKAAR